MKVLFLPWSTATHYFHQVPLAWAFRAAGAQVRVASQSLAIDSIKRSGMVVATVGAGYDFLPGVRELTTDSRLQMPALRQIMSDDYLERADSRQAAPAAGDRKDLTSLRKELVERQLVPFVKAAVASADDLAALVRAWRPDLVIADPFALAAPVAAKEAGAPLVHLQWGPAIHRQAGTWPGSGMPPELWPDDLQRMYERFDLEPCVESAVATVDPCPERLQFPVIPSRIPARFVPYNGTGDAPDWLWSPPKRRRVCVSWGTATTMVAGKEGFLVPRILEALAEYDVEVVATVNAADHNALGQTSAQVRVAEQLPLHLLLPTCDAIFHQGGAGTMLTAAYFGLPQVIVAGVMDQTTNATKLASVRAGVAVNWADADLAELDGAAATVLSDPSVRRSARQLQEEILAQPAPAQIVGTLEKLVS